MFKTLNRLIFPIDNMCLMCKERNASVKAFLCPTCQDNLEIAEAEISIDSPHMEKTYYCLTYNRFARDMVQDYKFHGKNYLYKALGEILLNAYYNIGMEVDKIAYVPMHRKKEALRGYNQAELLARYVSDKLEKPLIKDLIKIKNTREQSGSSKIQRSKNLKHSFKVKDPRTIEKARILLIDDIITTGATMDECSRVFIEAGGKEVFGLAITSSIIN